jgi:hypothetical protein
VAVRVLIESTFRKQLLFGSRSTRSLAARTTVGCISSAIHQQQLAPTVGRGTMDQSGTAELEIRLGNLGRPSDAATPLYPVNTPGAVCPVRQRLGQYRIRRRFSLWYVLLLLVLLDGVGIIGTVTRIWFPTGDPSSPYRSVHIEPDGALILHDHGPKGQFKLDQVLRPGSAFGELPLWWLVGTCFGLGLLTFIVPGTRVRRRLSPTRLKRPRFTMSRGMMVIGAISIWLWLSRMEIYWIFCGSLVLLLALVADSRRSHLAHEIKTKGASVTLWMRLGIACWWAAVILALWWTVCVLVLDSLRPAGSLPR